MQGNGGRRRVASVAVIGGVTALFAVMIAAATMQGIPEFNPPPFAGGYIELVPPPMETPLGADETPEAEVDPETAERFTRVVSTIGNILGLIMLIGLSWWLWRMLRRAWRDRALARREGAHVAKTPAVGEPPVENVDAEVVRIGIAGALHVIQQGGDPGDAIVAAWIGLEQTAAQAGFVRGAAETPAEFALRIISRTEHVAPEADQLLRLYERVRFGGYAATEPDREAARKSLQRIATEWQ